MDITSLSIIKAIEKTFGFIEYEYSANSLIYRKTKRIKRLFRVHCRNVIRKDNTYSLNSVRAIFFAQFCLLNILLMFLGFIFNKNYIIIKGITFEASLYLIFLLVGFKTFKQLISETKITLKKVIRLFLIVSLILNIILYFLYTLTGSNNLEIFFLGNKYFIGIFFLVNFAMFLFYKLIPVMFIQSCILVYKKIIARCYERYCNDPLKHFLRYFGYLSYGFAIIESLIFLAVYYN